MRARTAMWFESKISYEKVMEDGLQKKVTETYTINACSYSEAESRIVEEMKAFLSTEFEVADIKKAGYKEIFFDNEKPFAESYYRAKVAFTIIDEKTEQQKQSVVTYLVQADSFGSAYNNLLKTLSGTFIDYVIVSINQTKILDVFEYQKEEKPDYQD